MKEKFLHRLFVLTFLFPGIVFSQGENNNWYFGGHAGVTFNTIPPSALLNLSMTALHCSSCVSDSLGVFLMATNGWYIYDRNFQKMPNGSGIYGNANYTQGVIFVKKPGEDSVYYLFSARKTEYPLPLNLGLYYSLIDLRLNNGLGDVVPGMKNIPINGGEIVNKRLQAIRHYNNKDVWIVTFDTLNRYLAYLVDVNGISNAPVISQSALDESVPLNNDGDLKLSQDGTKLILMDPWDSMAEFCHFNDTTGVVTPLFTFCPIADSGFVSARPAPDAEFSPDGKLLYLTAIFSPGDSLNICQYETMYTNPDSFVQSQVIIGTDWFGSGLQLASNGKIYQTRIPNDYLNVIHNPDVKGSGCNFEINGIWLKGRASGDKLTSFLQVYKAYLHYKGNCQWDSIHFSGDIWPPADSIHWDFGDPGSGVANFSNDPTPTHIYSLPGQYTVELFVRHMDNR
ncbi:MAG: PKD domain-containing protein, partial [Bacteroidota bacterium]